MNRLAIKISLIILTVFLFSCASAPVKKIPAWINEPGNGAVGSSLTHFKGLHFQEDLAISLARERLAARYGVEVSSVQTIKEKVVNDRAYVTSEKEIQQRVNKTTVKAQVRETWHDKARDEIWVWVYPISE